MTSWRPYLWKEIHQNLRLGLAAMGLFLGITLIPCLIQAIYSKGHWWYSDDGIETILWAGPIFAVIAGLRAMGREQGAIEGFWRSRPVNLQRWLIVKYLTGLAIVWLVCWISVLSPSPMMGMFFNATMRSPYIADDVAMIVPHSFILMLIYSASFVLGQCVRNILHAAILAVGAMAMIFILPLVVAPLHWLSMEIVRRADTQSLDARSFVSFAAGMTAMSIALLWLAGVLLKRNIQIEINGRTLGWSIVGILLVLVAGVAFPMGTNLPAQQVVSLPIDQRGDAYEMAADGNDVLVLLSSIPERGSSRERKYGLVRAHIGEQTSSMDAPIWFADPGQEQGLYYSVSDLMWSGGTSSPAYTLVARGVILPDGTFGGWSHELCTIALDSGEGDPVIHRVPLNPLLGTEGIWPTACVYRQRLYIHRQQYPKAQLLTFSLLPPDCSPSRWLTPERLRWSTARTCRSQSVGCPASLQSLIVSDWPPYRTRTTRPASRSHTNWPSTSGRGPGRPQGPIGSLHLFPVPTAGGSGCSRQARHRTTSCPCIQFCVAGLGPLRDFSDSHTDNSTTPPVSSMSEAATASPCTTSQTRIASSASAITPPAVLARSSRCRAIVSPWPATDCTSWTCPKGYRLRLAEACVWPNRRCVWLARPNSFDRAHFHAPLLGETRSSFAWAWHPTQSPPADHGLAEQTAAIYPHSSGQFAFRFSRQNWAMSSMALLVLSIEPSSLA